MVVTCPRCHRSLSSADGADAPSFCMYCGQKLRDELNTSDGAMRTQSFTPTASGSENGDEVPLAAEPAPKSIGGYRLLRLLGAGGMGAVYEAESTETGNRVAVKLLSSKLASSPTSVERFKQEGRLASQLAHPRCVFVLSADADAGRPYIVMELMPGETLKDVVEKRGPLPPEEAILRMLDVIDGLAEAHRVGMIHRDMKPSNCFLTADDRVKVGDFGLSKSLTTLRTNHLTQSGAFLGTVLFASPEQIRGEPLDYGSDVYSVCATLYFLLCGEAPYHHESVTAALAKAISEPPPPIRTKRPEVPRGLEAVVMKGLERDRDRRWQSLDDLREALVALLPRRQHPARPRALIGAYALDRIFLGFLTVPVELVRMWATGATEGKIDVFEFRWLSIVLLLAYFAIAEGIFGATLGKWMLGLRVSRAGQTEPPGVPRALLRTVVFHLLLFSLILIPEKFIEWLGPAAGGTVGGILFIVAAAALALQLRKRNGFRGVHDLASGCHVTQRPLPARKLRLPIRQPTPLHTLLPAATDPLPETVGGYAIRGRLAVEDSGEQVWVGEDRSLARAVLLWLRPIGGNVPAPTEVSRPTRLRRLSSGSLGWAGQGFDWTAFAAPLGGPLLEAVNPKNPLPWADARLLLEQLVEELRAAEIDGSTLPRLRLERVWVEPNGRVQLLECPVAGSGTTATASPFTLLREVASLALEGQPRATAGGVRAPLPPHAVPVLEKLFTDGGYPTLTDFQRELADTHIHRPEVSPAVRAAHLGVQAAALVVPLAVMFALVGILPVILVVSANLRAAQAQAALDACADAEKKAKLAARSELVEPLKHPKLIERLERLRGEKRDEDEFRRSMLLAPHVLMVKQYEDHAPESAEREAGYPTQAREAIQWAGAAEGTPRARKASPWSSDATPILALLLVIPLGMVLAAAVFRGGLSMLLTGIAVVRTDGRPATRRQCALRAAVVWFPVAASLFGSAVLTTFYPERVYLALGWWLLAVVLLVVYVVVALRFPARPPQDRLTGTHLVPV